VGVVVFDAPGGGPPRVAQLASEQSAAWGFVFKSGEGREFSCCRELEIAAAKKKLSVVPLRYVGWQLPLSSCLDSSDSASVSDMSSARGLVCAAAVTITVIKAELLSRRLRPVELTQKPSELYLGRSNCVSRRDSQPPFWSEADISLSPVDVGAPDLALHASSRRCDLPYRRCRQSGRHTAAAAPAPKWLHW
jgi:hypothetical protein